MIDKEKGNVKARGIDTALSVGMTIFGTLFGRRGLSIATANQTIVGLR